MPSLLLKGKNKNKNKSISKSRVINVSSRAEGFEARYDYISRIFDASLKELTFLPKSFVKDYTGFKAYGLSKSCNVLHAREFARRYSNKDIICVSLHPGSITETELTRNMNFSVILDVLSQQWTLIKLFGLSALLKMLFEEKKNMSQGAATTLRCVSLKDDEIKNGHYYVNCNDDNSDLRGISGIDLNNDNKLAKKLWQLTEKLIESKGYSLQP